MPSLEPASNEFTAAEHAYALFMRLVFLVGDAALVGVTVMSFPLFIWVFMTVLGLPSPMEFISALLATGASFLFLRKAIGAARTAVFDAIRNRALRRQSRDVPRENVALDATASSGGAPMAVSVDVDHEVPASRSR